MGAFAGRWTAHRAHNAGVAQTATALPTGTADASDQLWLSALANLIGTLAGEYGQGIQETTVPGCPGCSGGWQLWDWQSSL